jgi:hemoglobin
MYDKVLDSDQIGDFFEEVDMKLLVDHQVKLISSLLGGPASYTDEQLRHNHGQIGISDLDFNEFVMHFGEALKEHGFEPADCDAAMREMEARRSYIVSQGAG